LAITSLPETRNAESLPEVLLNFPDNRLMIDLCGEFDRNLAQIEHGLDVQIVRRGNELVVGGEASDRNRAVAVLNNLYDRLASGRTVDHEEVDAEIRFGSVKGTVEGQRKGTPVKASKENLEINTRKKRVEPRTVNQTDYVRQLLKDELVFGLGPAGTGKTYLAVAAAVSLFIDGSVDRIVLSRPAVEAGERLGFLPGDMKDKVDPYMQPLYDALNDFLPGKQLAKLIEEKQIEIAPLAFMRGRTLSNAFVVLDEAQNATSMQMKMFLTRLGPGSKMAITGDPSQVDLPRGVPSGLIQAATLLRRVPGVGFTHFTAQDVVRHPLVAKIIEAYESGEKPDG